MPRTLPGPRGDSPRPPRLQRRRRHANATILAFIAGLLLTPDASARNGPDRHATAGPAQASHALDSISVSARRPRPEEVDNALTPGSTALVDSEDLRGRSVNGLEDALRYVPGIWTPSSSGGDNGYLSIRGSNLDATDYDNNGVMLLQDGLPISAADGSNHNRFPDPLAAQRIIVRPGASALSYGASQLGGAIDFVSRTARNSDPAQAFLLAGDHGLRAARVSTGAAGETLDGLLMLEGRHAEGWREHAHQRRHGAYGNVGLRVSPRLDLRFFGTWIDNDQELAGGIDRATFERDRRQANPSYIAGDHQINVRSTRYAGTGQWRIDHRSTLDFGVSLEKQSLYHPIVHSPFFSLLVDTDQRTLGAMVRYTLRLDRHDIIAGINLARTTTTGANFGNAQGLRGPLQDRVAQRAATSTVFALDRWQLTERWTLVYGAQGVLSRRVDRNVDGAGQGATDPRDRRDRYTSLNPRIGVIRSLAHGSELFASASRVYQAPGSYDLDHARSERGPDATLRAMRGLMLEGGIRGSKEAGAGAIAARWDLTVYHGRLRDEIVAADDPAAPGNVLTSNAPRTTHAGIEARLAGRVPIGEGRSIDPLVSATYNHFRFDGDPQYGNNRLPNAPRYVVHGELLYRSPHGFHAGPTFDLVGARYADYASSYKVGAHGLVGFRAGIRREHWEVFVEARNLADRRYVSTLGVVDRAQADSAVLSAGPGRSIQAGLSLRY